MLILTFGSALSYAQIAPGAQAGASAQSQAGVNAQTQRPGAQASGAGSASTQANASASADRSGPTISDGTTVNAALQSTLDAKKSKPGDRVEARTTQDVKQDGKVVLAKGTRLVGHVTQAQARGAGESKSVLGVMFDSAESRSGQVPVNFAIQALASAQSAADASSDDGGLLAAGGGTTSAVGGSSRASGGGLLGGAVGAATSTTGNVAGGIGGTAGTAVGSTVNTTAQSAGGVGGLNAAGALASNSRGVFGLEGVSLDSAASSATQGSMIVSPTSDVHLASGTQMLLRAGGQAR
jgi:hypothetical protein